MTDLKNTQETYTGLATPGINGGLPKRVWDFPTTTLFSPYLAISQMVGRSEDFHIIPSAGFRYFVHDEFEDKSAPQAGLVMGFGHTDLNLNYSRGINYPSPVALMNMVLESSPVTNPEQYWKKIKPEVVDHYEISLIHTWPKIASLSATAFLDKGKDRYRTYMFGPIPPQFNDPIGDYKIRGLEFSGTVTPVKNLELFAATTWLHAEATGNNGIETDHLPYTPSFQFQAGANWTFLENFRLFMDMQHLKGLYQGTVSRAGGFNISDPGPINKLDDITLVNASLSYRFNYRSLRLSDSEVFVTVNNILDQKYEYVKGYPMPGTTVFAGVRLRFN
jgi:iron complex outermembrane receptor protein